MINLLLFLAGLVASRVFRFRPRIRKEKQVLVASSGWRSQVLTLGGWHRRVEIDPSARMVRVRSRYLWCFVRPRQISFDRVAEVLYGYHQLNPESAMPAAAYQEADLFTVGLRLDGGDEVTLFRFFGEGAFVDNSIFPDWVHWDNQVEARWTAGDQEDESRLFAELLSGLIGVPVGQPR